MPALCRHSQDTQIHRRLGEGSRLRDGRGRNLLDEGRGQAADTKLLASVPAASSWDFRNVLKLFAPRWPELVLNLARTRLERGLQQPEHFTLPPWHHHHPLELVARHPSTQLGPSATADRPVGRVTGALTPAPSLSLLR